VKRSKARLAWGLAVMWDAESEPEAAVPAVATVVHVVHHYLPAPSVGGIGPDPLVVQAIVQNAITTGEEEQSTCA
jgi:hypothetical protein